MAGLLGHCVGFSKDQRWRSCWDAASVSSDDRRWRASSLLPVSRYGGGDFYPRRQLLCPEVGVYTDVWQALPARPTTADAEPEETISWRSNEMISAAPDPEPVTG
ncbi:hypothetical protein ZHAS_00017557 [Anopheles sinensis]|uniref:Uncharacterized protein n=1 Tax=Anopheles sinensis TaxID=74873 RepID=A0A084WH56_ANOSI|nr:hypothetical protein ZHAS_00017557 [Anopheles sinensis]